MNIDQLAQAADVALKAAGLSCRVEIDRDEEDGDRLEIYHAHLFSYEWSVLPPEVVIAETDLPDDRPRLEPLPEPARRPAWAVYRLEQTLGGREEPPDVIDREIVITDSPWKAVEEAAMALIRERIGLALEAEAVRQNPELEMLL